MTKGWEKIGIVMLALMCVSLANFAKAEELSFFTHNAEKFSYLDPDGYLRGLSHGGRRAFAIEVVHELRKRLNQTGLTGVVPFKRGMNNLKTHKNTILYTVNRTERREDLFQWVGPVQKTVTHVIDHIAHPTNISKLDDLRGLASICVVRGNVHDEALSAMGLENLIRVNNYANCAKMLKKNRTSATLLSNTSPLFKDPEYRDILHRTNVIYAKSAGYIAFSRDVAPSRVESWQAEFDKMQADGTFKELYEEFYETQ